MLITCVIISLAFIALTDAIFILPALTASSAATVAGGLLGRGAFGWGAFGLGVLLRLGSFLAGELFFGSFYFGGLLAGSFWVGSFFLGSLCPYTILMFALSKHQDER